MSQRKTLVVAGHGMVGHRFVQAAVERGLTERFDIVVVGEEPRPAYDRVALTSFFDAATADELSLLPDGRYDDPRVRLVLDTPVTDIERDGQFVVLGDGQRIDYDVLVLATGARPFVPPIAGHDLDGCFVYRTIEDLEAIREASRTASVGAVIGGGLLGPGGRERAAAAGPGDPCRGDGTTADAGAARRGRRRHPGPTHREPRREGAHRRGDGPRRREGRLGGRPRARRGDDRRRGGGLLRGHPAARRPGPCRGPRPRRARRRPGRRALPHLRSRRSSRSASARPRRGGCTAWSHPATTWPRSSSTTCSAARVRSPAPTCPPSSSCSASTWPASATRSRPRPTRWSWSTPMRSPASTRSSWWVSTTTGRRAASSAASSSGTRRRTASCARWSRAGSRCRTTPRT